MFVFELIVDLLAGLVTPSISRPESSVGKSRLEHGLTRFWRWVGGVALCLAAAGGLYLWASHRL